MVCGGCMGDDKTHVEISTGTRNRLRVWKAKRGLTYSEAIDELIDRSDALAEALEGMDKDEVLEAHPKAEKFTEPEAEDGR